MEQIYRSYKDLFLLGVLIGPLAGLVILGLRWRRRRRPDAWRTAVLDVLICCACVPALGFTLTGGATFDRPRFRVVPFREIADLLTHSLTLEIGLIQVLGNLFLLAALGGLLPMRWQRLASWPALLTLGLAVATSIETAQAFLGRVASIDDVILNVAGVLLGAALTHRWWTPAGPRPAVPNQDSHFHGSGHDLANGEQDAAW